MNRRGALDTDPGHVWPEFVAGTFLLMGFVLAISTSVLVNYILITLAGLAFGRAFARYDQDVRFTTPLIVLGFTAGFLLGAFGTDLRAILLLFIGAGVTSYLLHQYGWVHSIEV